MKQISVQSIHSATVGEKRRNKGVEEWKRVQVAGGVYNGIHIFLRPPTFESDTLFFN
jgi:hypothetical protein